MVKNFDEEALIVADEEDKEIPEKDISGFDNTKSRITVENDNEEVFDNSFKWDKATHTGVCKKCHKVAVREGLQSFEVELNDRGLCQSHEKQRKVKIGLLVGLILTLLLALVIGLCAGWFDSNAGKGPYEGKSQEQIIADLNAQVAEGEMNVSIANTIRFPNGSQNDGIANIENIEANHLDQKISLFLVDSNECIYESGAIAPGYHITNIKLNKYLEPGQYKAVALVTGYQHEEQGTVESFFNNLFNNHKKVGALGAQINLLVE